MDLILSEEPSTDDRNVQLEPTEVEVDTLVDVQRKKMLSMSTFHFVSKHFRFFGFQYILGLTSCFCIHLCRMIHLMNPTLCVLLMSQIRMTLSSRFGDRKKKTLSV
jgi:hypothetical protein